MTVDASGCKTPQVTSPGLSFSPRSHREHNTPWPQLKFQIKILLLVPRKNEPYLFMAIFKNETFEKTSLQTQCGVFVRAKPTVNLEVPTHDIVTALVEHAHQGLWETARFGRQSRTIRREAMASNMDEVLAQLKAASMPKPSTDKGWREFVRSRFLRLFTCCLRRVLAQK
jgi:hypothetical protein